MRGLNLGCGPYRVEGFINIDANPRQTQADLIRDVRKGLPFDDNSVDAITASHFLEHLDFEEMLFVLEECYRVLKPQCCIKIVCPVMEFSSMDHKQWMAEDYFDILARDAPEQYNKNFKWALISKSVVDKSRGKNLKVELQAMK